MRSLLPLLLWSAASLAGAPQPAALFSDHAVLQQGRTLPVWGKARPGENIRVTYRGNSVETTADTAGRWRVHLPPQPAGASGELVIAGDATLTFGDVIVGEVWLCAGQSNMVWHLSQAEGGRADAAATDLPLVRHFKVKRAKAAEPLDDVEGEWEVATRKTVGDWSAVGFYFARSLHAQRKAPVGLINTAWSGTDIEAWISREGLAASPAAPAVASRWKKLAETHPRRLADHQTALARWETAKAEAEAAGREFTDRRPKSPEGPGSSSEPSVIFNGEIHPLVPFALAGILWYQGENNAGRPAEYADLQRALIRDWRLRWGDPALPFLHVQLPNYAARKPAATGWAFFREAQTRTLDEPATGMAVTMDVGASGTVHPTRKREVGERLALLARSVAYGETGVPTGPRFLRAEPEDPGLRLRFEDGGAPLALRAEGEQPAFQISGDDGVFHRAHAELRGAELFVSSPLVPAPRQVRYAWANDPSVTLFNCHGLPAAPFRTDGDQK